MSLIQMKIQPLVCLLAVLGAANADIDPSDTSQNVNIPSSYDQDWGFKAVSERLGKEARLRRVSYAPQNRMGGSIRITVGHYC